jgi:hypothetical protein
MLPKLYTDVTAWSGVHLEKLIFAKLVRRFLRNTEFNYRVHNTPPPPHPRRPYHGGEYEDESLLGYKAV